MGKQKCKILVFFLMFHARTISFSAHVEMTDWETEKIIMMERLLATGCLLKRNRSIFMYFTLLRRRLQTLTKLKLIQWIYLHRKRVCDARSLGISIKAFSLFNSIEKFSLLLLNSRQAKCGRNSRELPLSNREISFPFFTTNSEMKFT